MKILLAKITIFSLICCAFAISCKSDEKAPTKADPVLSEIGGKNYQDFIRTPVNTDGTLDSTKMPRIVFENDLHNFGTLTQTEKKTHEFEFENTGTVDLYLLNVNTSCGCTVASYDEDAISPGKKGKIVINYDPKNRKGIQEKKIVVSSNAYPNKTELTIIADILEID